MGADIIIAVNPNAGAFPPSPARTTEGPNQGVAEPSSPAVPDKAFASVPAGIGLAFRAIAPEFLSSRKDTLGYFNVLSTSIDIMTSHILRSRLAGEPPHVMINVQLSHLRTLEFQRAGEAATHDAGNPFAPRLSLEAMQADDAFVFITTMSAHLRVAVAALRGGGSSPTPERNERTAS